MNSLLLATGASAGFAQSWAPAYSMGSMASTGALVQPSYSMSNMASTGALVQPSFQRFQPSFNSFESSSTGAYAAPVLPLQTSYMSNVAEMGSAGNPYNKLNLGRGKLIGRTKGKSMGGRQVMVGEKHVVHNDLKVLENHEADKTIFTKKVIHHSPVLHKTIRTHKIAEDTIHEKLVHHMNTVKDQFKKVPGQNYVGGEQHVDHTEAIASAPMISGKSYAPMASAASTGAYRV